MRSQKLEKRTFLRISRKLQRIVFEIVGGISQTLKTAILNQCRCFRNFRRKSPFHVPIFLPEASTKNFELIASSDRMYFTKEFRYRSFQHCETVRKTWLCHIHIKKNQFFFDPVNYLNTNSRSIIIFGCYGIGYYSM